MDLLVQLPLPLVFATLYCQQLPAHPLSDRSLHTSALRNAATTFAGEHSGQQQ